jgi:formamidopyrimidine-DNA glycosylase
VPELPELETLKQQLQAHVLGREIRRLVVPEGKDAGCPVSRWKAAVEGAAIVDVQRRGKMLILQLESGFSLVIHLMMVGQLSLSSLGDVKPNDVRLVLDFGDDALSLGQVHLKFLRLVPTAEVDDLPELRKLGPDPLGEGFTVSCLRDKLSGRRGKIKSFLLDQRHIAGIGNTYADEILFVSGIRPTRSPSSLTQEEIGGLHDSIVSTLQLGLRLGGSSEMAFVHLDGSKGRFQDHFQVKGRKGDPCFVCGALIEKVSIGGRGTYFCPACQT